MPFQLDSPVYYAYQPRRVGTALADKVAGHGTEPSLTVGWNGLTHALGGNQRLMAIPIKYNFRNLVVRRTTTLMTALSITLTVTVFVVLMALAQGLQISLSATGQPLNVIIMREGSQSEATSSVTRDSLQVIRYLEGIAKTDKGEPWVSPELIVLINLPRRGQTQGSNVTIRGLGPDGPSLRPEFKMVAGRFFRSGLREVIVSKRISERFQDCGLGDKLKFAKGYWTVVGLFDAGGTAYDSEIWTDVERPLGGLRPRGVFLRYGARHRCRRRHSPERSDLERSPPAFEACLGA